MNPTLTASIKSQSFFFSSIWAEFSINRDSFSSSYRDRFLSVSLIPHPKMRFLGLFSGFQFGWIKTDFLKNLTTILGLRLRGNSGSSLTSSSIFSFMVELSKTLLFFFSYNKPRFMKKREVRTRTTFRPPVQWGSKSFGVVFFKNSESF